MKSELTTNKQCNAKLRACVALSVAVLLWMPPVHWLFIRPFKNFDPHLPGIAPKAQALAARHLELWKNGSARKGELDRMRRSNAEWDFMGRSFLVWSLVEMGLREPVRKPEYLAVID